MTYVFKPVDPYLEYWVNATYGTAAAKTGVPVGYLKKLFPQVVKHGPHPEDVLPFIKTIAKAGEMFSIFPRPVGSILLNFTKSWQVLAATMPDRKILDNLIRSHSALDFALNNYSATTSIVHAQFNLGNRKPRVVIDEYYKILEFLDKQEISLQNQFETGLFFTRAAIYSKHLVGENFESEPGVMKAFDTKYRDALLAPYREMSKALDKLES